MPLNFVRMIVVFLLVIGIGLFTGKGFSRTKIHESGNAQYIQNHYCLVDNTIPYDQYVSLLAWCDKEKLAADAAMP